MTLLAHAVQASRFFPARLLLLLFLTLPLSALPLPDATVTSTFRGSAFLSSSLSSPRHKHATPGAPPAHSLLQQLRAAPRVVPLSTNADHFSPPGGASAEESGEARSPSTAVAGNSASTSVSVSASTEPWTPLPPAPRPWPEQFHAVLFQNRSGRLALTELWYDWPGGRNLNAIRPQLAAGTLMDVEWSNGTSFYYNLQERSCRVITFTVGILRPDWLAGATLVSEGEVVDGKFRCRVWTKADFILYYEDMQTGFPVKWVFLGSGGIFHVLSLEPGATLPDVQWQAPAICFQ